MAKDNHHLLIFGFFIFLTTSVGVISADEIKKDDDYNYYYVPNHQNPAYANSELTVINQSDPIDNYQGSTYDCLDFISRITTNERNLVGYVNDCSGDCSRYSNNFQLYHEDYKGKSTDYCLGRLRDCVQYKEPIGNSASTMVYGLWNWLTLLYGQQDLTSFLDNRRVLLHSVCPTCKCYCDSYLNPNLTASICLDPVLANVAEGYVVTGVRLKIIDKTIRIQIQQGKLVGNIIDFNTRNWQDINDCKESIRMNYDNRTMHMDDIILPEGFSITGVSFSLTQSSKGFYLSVYGKPSHELKNLQVNSTEFFNPPGNRINLMAPDMEPPTSGEGKNVELSIPGQSSIIFQTLGLTQDNNLNDQQLMPFLDIREVISVNDANLLRGMGIYWRGKKDHGGYIAFKLFVDKYPVEVNIVHEKST